MNSIILASGLMQTLSNYLPLIVVIVALALLFVIFRLVGVRRSILWRLLINGFVGAVLLAIFDLIFYSVLKMDFFYIPITWLNSAIAGVLGVPGIVLLLILKVFIL